MNAHTRPPPRPRFRLASISPNAQLAWLTGAVMVLAIALGGSSRFNSLESMIIELAALPLVALVLWRLSQQPLATELRIPLVLIGAAFAILLVQLIPLPDALWAKLPGHAPVAELRRLAGVTPGWSPISLNPGETVIHLLALIPPVAVFLAVAMLPSHRRRWLTLAPLAMATISVGLGALQVASGPDSNLFPYANSDRDSAVGIFSNRNHQATLLVASLPLAALWLQIDRHQARRNLLPVAAAMGLFLVEIIALIVVKSRAGVILLVPALIGSLMLVWRGDLAQRRQTVPLLAGVVAIALFAGVAFGIGPVLDRFSSGEGAAESGRWLAAVTTARAALDFMPFGAGSGTFVQVFTAYEPVEAMGPKFWNHAHNDYLEILLGTGLLGLAALVGFLGWVVMRTWSAWREPPTAFSNLACSGSIVVALILVHSTLDYPLRTLSIAVIFAFALGLLVSPGEEARRSRR